MTFDPPDQPPEAFGPIDGPPPPPPPGGVAPPPPPGPPGAPIPPAPQMPASPYSAPGPAGYQPSGYQPGGYQPGGYPPAGGPPPFGSMPTPSKTSALAVASLISGLIGLFTCVVVIVPLAAIILGVFGLRDTSADPQGVKGRGMAISGIVLGAIGLMIGAFFIVAFALGDGRTGTSSSFPAAEESAAGAPSLLAPGNCVEYPVDVAFADLEQVPCNEPHGAEVFYNSVVDPSLSFFPGDTEIEQLSDQVCSASFEDYVGIDVNASELDVYYFSPTQSSWDLGDRDVLCLALPATGDLDPGSIQGSGI